MRHFRAALVVYVLGLLFSINCYAWNAEGHRVIAAIAYDRLKPNVKAKVDQLVNAFSNQYTHTNSFDEIAPWPDSVKNNKQWHYTDTPFSTDNTPIKDIKQPYDVVWAINHITTSFNDSTQQSSEPPCYLLAFLVHTVGDVHQPLHTVSRISAQYPDGDRGGNLFKLTFEGKQSQLHHAWDTGAGLFDTNTPSEQQVIALAKKITTDYPESRFSTQIADLTPEDWVNEGVDVAKKHAYNTPEHQKPSSEYLDTGKQVAEQRAALAGYRLAALLNKLLG